MIESKGKERVGQTEKKSAATATTALNLKVNCKNIALVIGLLRFAPH